MLERSFHLGSAVETPVHFGRWYKSVADYLIQLSQAKSQLKCRSRHLAQWQEKSFALLRPEYEVQSSGPAVKQLLDF